MDVTVLICTCNRRKLLSETLDSLAEMVVPESWRCEILVVDNGSTDETREAVLNRAPDSRLPLRYIHEPALGKSNAMNAGIGASDALVLACTDDDVRVTRDWLTAGCAPLLARSDGFAYTGGPVRPIWDGPCPEWFPRVWRRRTTTTVESGRGGFHAEYANRRRTDGARDGGICGDRRGPRRVFCPGRLRRHPGRAH